MLISIKEQHIVAVVVDRRMPDVDHATRVIGYLKRVSSFSSGRQQEYHLRHYYFKNNTEELQEHTHVFWHIKDSIYLIKRFSDH